MDGHAGREPRRPRATLVEATCRSALNRVAGMWFRWSVNAYVGCVHRCTFCYVRAFEKRAERDWAGGYGLTVRVKTNVADVLRGELARRSWRRELVVLGTATDPYQPAEGRYRLTRGILEALAAARTPVSITTRGPLVIRDLDILAALSRRVPVTVTFSVPSVDDRVWRTTEPGTAPPRQRLRALRALADAGIRTGVLMAPLLPGVSDDPAGIEAVARAAREAGAAFLGAGTLALRDGVRQHYLESLARDHPEAVEATRRLYADRVELPRAVAAEPLRMVGRLRDRLGIVDRRPPEARPAPPPAQMPLFG